MATTTNTKPTPTTTKAAPKAAPTATPKAQAKPVPAPTPTHGAPLFVFGPWPAKAQSGNTIRAYCASVAKQLTKAQPNGFTVLQLATAFCANAATTTYRQPGAGFNMVQKGGNLVPNGLAMQHATYFCAPAQGWCAPATAPAAK